MRRPKGRAMGGKPIIGYYSTDPEWQRLSPGARQALSYFSDLDLFEATIVPLAAAIRRHSDDPVDAGHELARIEAALDEAVAAGYLEIWLGRLPAVFYPATPVALLQPIGLKDRLRLSREDVTWVLHNLQPEDEFAFGMVTNRGKRLLGRVYAGTEDAVLDSIL